MIPQFDKANVICDKTSNQNSQDANMHIETITPPEKFPASIYNQFIYTFVIVQNIHPWNPLKWEGFGLGDFPSHFGMEFSVHCQFSRGGSFEN